MRYPISDHARELAITDFRFTARAYAVLTDQRGRSYLAYAPVWPAPKPAAPTSQPSALKTRPATVVLVVVRTDR